MLAEPLCICCEESVQTICPFIIWAICLIKYKRPLYALDRSPLSEIFIMNILLSSVVCFFIFLMVPFKKQKFLILMRFRVSFLSEIVFQNIYVSIEIVIGICVYVGIVNT